MLRLTASGWPLSQSLLYISGAPPPPARSLPAALPLNEVHTWNWGGGRNVVGPMGPRHIPQSSLMTSADEIF